MAKTVSKRLGIELASLRQHLWRTAGQPLPDRRFLAEKPANAQRSDCISWVDTEVMVEDALTKQMNDHYLLSVLDSNIWDRTQTEEAKAVEARKQAARSKT